MGITKIDVTVINPERPKKKISREFLVDSGAAYSVIPYHKNAIDRFVSDDKIMQLHYFVNARQSDNFLLYQY